LFLFFFVFGVFLFALSAVFFFYRCWRSCSWTDRRLLLRIVLRIVISIRLGGTGSRSCLIIIRTVICTRYVNY
jgi:hypothetical protein